MRFQTLQRTTSTIIFCVCIPPLLLHVCFSLSVLVFCGELCELAGIKKLDWPECVLQLWQWCNSPDTFADAQNLGLLFVAACDRLRLFSQIKTRNNKKIKIQRSLWRSLLSTPGDLSLCVSHTPTEPGPEPPPRALRKHGPSSPAQTNFGSSLPAVWVGLGNCTPQYLPGINISLSNKNTDPLHKMGRGGWVRFFAWRLCWIFRWSCWWNLIFFWFRWTFTCGTSHY